MSDYPPPPPPSPPPPPGSAGAGEPLDALGRPLAAWGLRLGAFVIDELFVFVMTLCAAILFGLRHRFLGAVLSLVMAAAYYAVLNGSEMGQTFGKRVVGIQVRDGATGGSIGVERAALRYVVVGLFRIVPFFGLFTLLDGLWPLWDPARQALHDKIAGSVVVRLTPS
jgi:uncharacterized RDD family membrane protein YckC